MQEKLENTISAFIKTNITINHPQDFDLGVCSVLIWKYLSKILLLSMWGSSILIIMCALQLSTYYDKNTPPNATEQQAVIPSAVLLSVL